jgi:Fanconi anemia group I protein
VSLQVLLLSSQGHRCHFLRDIFQLFNDLDEKCEWNTGRAQSGEIVEAGISEAELVHIEGTVIHYFSFAVKQDPGLGNDILKLLKARQFQLSPFEVALLLSLYKVQRYEAKIFEILKRAVECEHTHDFQKSVSPWIESLHDLVSPTSMSSVMKAVLRRSGKGWEHIMAGFVGFALNLLICFSKKSCNSKSQQSESQVSGAVVSMGSLTSGTGNKGISKHVACFSLQLLERAFRKHEAVRNEILGQIFSGVVTRDDSSTHFVQLLSKIANSCCRDVMDCVTKVKDALEYISFMPPNTAVSLVRSLQPVLRSQTSLQDFLLIVLRKSLFSRELESRLVTLECLLFIAGTSSPPSARPPVGHGSNSQISELELMPIDSVAIEIISQVRRCMSQQVQLRSALYDGLIELVTMKPALAEHILGILLPQLEKYIAKDGDGIISQVLIQTCIDEVSGGIGEPLAHLLRAIMNCLVVSAHIVDCAQVCYLGGSNIMQARSSMQKIATLLAANDLSDFDLDRQSEFEKPSVLNLAKLLHGVYEVTLEYTVVVISLSSQTWTKRFLTMIERIWTLTDLLKEHSRPAKGRKVSGSAVDDKATLISCQFSNALLAVVGDKVVDGCAFDSATCTSLFEDVQCMAMVLQTALKQVTMRIQTNLC